MSRRSLVVVLFAVASLFVLPCGVDVAHAARKNRKKQNSNRNKKNNRRNNNNRNSGNNNQLSGEAKKQVSAANAAGLRAAKLKAEVNRLERERSRAIGLAKARGESLSREQLLAMQDEITAARDKVIAAQKEQSAAINSAKAAANTRKRTINLGNPVKKVNTKKGKK